MLRATLPEADDEAVAAGREAEAAVRKVFGGHFSKRSASVHASMRVPRDPDRPYNNRGEIDLVVLTRRQLTAIEIKSWSGRLRLDGDDWVQERRSGEHCNHGDVLAGNEGKLEALCGYLRAHGAQPPRSCQSRILLWNPNLTLPPALAEREEVVLRPQLDAFLARQKAVPLGQRLMLAMLQMCLEGEAGQSNTGQSNTGQSNTGQSNTGQSDMGRSQAAGRLEVMPRRDFKRADLAISQLESFDKVRLHGGRILVGDIWGLNVGGSQMGFKRFASGSEMPVKGGRSGLGPRVKALLGLPLMSLRKDRIRVGLAPDDYIEFQPAGSPTKEQIIFARIEGLVRG